MGALGIKTIADVVAAVGRCPVAYYLAKAARWASGSRMAEQRLRGSDAAVAKQDGP